MAKKTAKRKTKTSVNENDTANSVMKKLILRDITPLFCDGDKLVLTAGNGKCLSVVNEDMLGTTVKPTEEDCFEVEHVDEYIALKFKEKYVTLDVTGCVTAKGEAVESASLLRVQLNDDGRVVIKEKSGAYWSLTPQEGVICEHFKYFCHARMEFKVDVINLDAESEQLKHHRDLSQQKSECEAAERALIFQITVNLILAIGIGPYIISDRLETGVWGLLSQNANVRTALDVFIKDAVKNPGRKFLAAMTFLYVVHEEGLLLRLMRLVLASVGWWALAEITAKVIEAIFAPEAELVELGASLTVWGVQTEEAVSATLKACSPTKDANAKGAKGKKK
ncbi:hypothetical protein [Pseudoalteromonas denitrificans]|uniref:Uncharacterized protein n=1 Tax=Pseudoalteromonas denitrificans DSM 6059 TaxID=1123010 RepID=A0A1I1V5E4_9GAMM|nr:hypothetical protein [Pseudoalteromonas denitrificans]SFD78262.1 hypothetical protein SAMN02745724_05430 [Pseudoalteromonas denitrificans DSM 6059]